MLRVAKAKSPAYSMYPDAFEQGTDEMTLAEVGAYIRLLNSQWNKGSIPGDNVDALSRILRCTRGTARSVWNTVHVKFVRGEDGKWQNPRLEKERRKQADRRAKLAANGAQGGRPQKPKPNQNETNRFQSGSVSQNQNESLPSPSPFPVPPTAVSPPPLEAGASPARKRNFGAVYEHSRFDVPGTWHRRRVDGLRDGEAGMRAFYDHLARYVDAHPDEDTEPRFEWLTGHFDAWVRSRTPQRSDVPGVEETRKRLGLA